MTGCGCDDNTVIGGMLFQAVITVLAKNFYVCVTQFLQPLLRLNSQGGDDLDTVNLPTEPYLETSAQSSELGDSQGKWRNLRLVGQSVVSVNRTT